MAGVHDAESMLFLLFALVCATIVLILAISVWSQTAPPIPKDMGSIVRDVCPPRVALPEP